MYRIAIEKLLKWKQNKRRKPLIIEGARQVGKTWLMKEFGRQEYKDTIYINFDSNSRMAELFASDLDTERLIMGLEIYVGRKINPDSALLIFDEVQEVPRALASLKYFYENAPEYHIVCAGSLLGIALHQGTSFPVGKVDFLKLYPLSFKEFLMANDKERFAELLDRQDFQMITSFKQIYIDALKQYYFVGCLKQYKVFLRIRTLMRFVKSRREFFLPMNRIFQNMLQMKLCRDYVCYGIAFRLSWQKKIKSLFMVLFAKVLVQKNMKPQLCGFVIVDLCIRSAVSMRQVFHSGHMRI